MTAGAEPDCQVWELDCTAKNIANGIAGDALGALAKAVGDAVGSVLTNLATVWVDVGTPNLTTAGSNPSDAVAFIQDSLWWYMAAAAVLSVMVGGARMAWTMRAEPGKDVLRSLMTLTAVSGAGLAVVALAVEAADRFAEWIIDRSTVGTNFGENLGALILAPLVTNPAGGAQQPVLIVILLGLVALISSFVQIVLMIVRSGMLVILAGIFPLAASFTTTETGRTWFRRCCAWLIAFILYKPAAAIVYATAFRLAGADLFGGSDGSGVLDVLVGVTMMVLAILALPALMRFVTPAVAVMSGSGGGGAGMAAAAAIPTGAAFARSGRDGSSGSSGGRGPAGASSTGGGPSSPSTPGAAQVPAQTGGSGAATTGARAAGGGAAGAGTTGAGAGTAATAGAAATGVGAVVAAGAMAAQATQRAATDAATRSTGEGS